MRGKLLFGSGHFVVAGITPAHAGKTTHGAMRSMTGRDHPRACGENRISFSVTTSCRGSPPRMRGKRLQRVWRETRVGITPAHAGKTFRPSHCPRCPRDHPRACGENFSSTSASRPRGGSPPRMRGKQLSRKCKVRQAGITPAHAGKTERCGREAHAGWDHPRACGENIMQCAVVFVIWGSPPRMRGKRVCAGIRCRASGITPAHAGKTPFSYLTLIAETRIPPRMRGKPRPVFLRAFSQGITPAHAGKTI